MDSMRVTVGENTNNQPQPQSQHSQIRPAGTHRQAAYYGGSEDIYRELGGQTFVTVNLTPSSQAEPAMA